MTPGRRPQPVRQITASAVALAAALAWLAGCATTQDERASSPPVELPSALGSADDQASSGGAALPARWWQALNDAALNAMVDEALEHNLNMRAMWARLDQAEASARLAGVDLYTPNVSLSAGADRAYAANPVREGDFFSVRATASYEVDVWGRLRSQQDAAEFDMRATQRDLQAAAMTLSAEIASAWYSLVQTRGQLALLDRQQETNTQIHDLIMLRVARGQASSAEALQQRRQIEAVRGERARLEAQREVLEHQLAVLLGKPPSGATLAPGDTLIALPPLPKLGVPGELIQRRPDVHGALLRVQAADARVASAIANRFPRLSLSATFNTNDPSPSELFNNWFLNLAANLTVPLINGAQLGIQVDISEATAAAAYHSYGQTILQALGEVEDALAQERRQREQLASIERQLALARSALDRARLDYINGASAYLTVLDTLRTMQTLERSRLEAQQLVIQHRISLCRALGGTWKLKRPKTDDAEGDAKGDAKADATDQDTPQDAAAPVTALAPSHPEAP